MLKHQCVVIIDVSLMSSVLEHDIREKNVENKDLASTILSQFKNIFEILFGVQYCEAVLRNKGFLSLVVTSDVARQAPTGQGLLPDSFRVLQRLQPAGLSRYP